MSRTPHPAVLVLTLLLGLALTACGGSSGATQAEQTPAPAGLTVQASSSTSVHVMWNRTEDAGITGYEVRQDGEPAAEVAAATYMVDITGLTPDTEYTFSVRATSAHGTSGDSRAVTVTTFSAATDDEEPPTAPGALTGAADGAHAATLSWEPASDNIAVTSYDIHQGDVRIHSVGGSETSTLITGLRPGTGYVFTVVARDAADNSSPPSEAVELTTSGDAGGEAGPATAPSGFEAVARDADGTQTIELSWTAPETGGDVLEYQIHLDGDFATTLLWGSGAPVGVATHTLTVDNEPGVTYAVKIRARLPDGHWGAFSPEVSVTTGED
ncbi:fibronectin type III domain-containing protein [Streptomyces otsuchiensis]|uniref:fibronectin type III domain-containing protein n=1 Tax=Streptomyces otsuchiensis TaxID=2681388 RepID=UPI001D13156D|nr:fibronectin type III domain-containing protein [Streptomyces otsuchiensis]